MSDRQTAAKDLHLTETTVIGGALVAISPAGTLYKWIGEQGYWAPLRVTRPFALTPERRSEIASAAARARWAS